MNRPPIKISSDKPLDDDSFAQLARESAAVTIPVPYDQFNHGVTATTGVSVREMMEGTYGLGSAAIPDGWFTVPIVPTPTMIGALMGIADGRFTVVQAWEALLEAVRLG